MRFAIAVAVLAQSLVVASNLAGGQDVLRQQSPPTSSGVSKLHIHRKLMHGEFLTNHKYAASHQHEGRKCDPMASSNEITDADTGILGCHPGEHCSAFGVCVADGGLDITTRSYHVDEDEYVFNHYDYYCNTTQPLYVYGGVPIDCNCSQINQETESGYFSCSTLTSTCKFDVCYSYSIGAEFDGDFTQFSYAYRCLDIYLPYAQQICYYFFAGYSCSINIDDQVCNSCEYYSDPIYGEFCSVFDCTNIADGNAGNNCAGVYASDIFDNVPILIPVEENVKYFQSIIYGISSMSIEEQSDWAFLTAKYIVNYFDTNSTSTVDDLFVVVDVLAVIPNEWRDQNLQECGGSVTIVYNIFLSYSIVDPTAISPADIAELPFLTEENQQAYAEFLAFFGSGSLFCISDVDLLGQREPICPGKGGKKGKKSSKKSASSSKSIKKGKGTGKGTQIYHPPPIEYSEDYYYHSTSSKKSGKGKGKGITASMYGYPENSSSHDKSDKKGKGAR